MTRCMGCMREYDGSTEVCPHCGYVRGTAAREAYHLPPESILQGRYIVGRVLGFGGFGVTYIGWDAQLERVVAIKEFLPTSFATRMPGGTAVTVYEGGATEQFGFGLHRFVEEAQRLAQFNGIRGITDIYDTFSGNNTAYIVMEYLKGRDVKEILTAEGPLSYEQAREIVLRVCDTLAPVHAKGIIHRDISPDNIYLTDDGEVKLLDFGAARYESSVNSKSLSVILKAGYAPEEQYRSRGDQGPWTDVYALAATFYKMLTGATPPDSMERAVRDELKEPSKAGAQLPKSAENAILNALNIRKADRTQSVEAFKEALQSDGVERVKAKARRGGGGRVPVPAIVAMGVAGLLLVAFFALGATGVVDLGGGAMPDNFGNAVQEGMAVVPSLVGLTQEEARKALEDEGFAVTIGNAYVSASIPLGNIAQQQPPAGRQIPEGDTVTIQPSAGTLQQAVDSGTIPIVGMSAVQFTGFVSGQNDYGLTDLYPMYAYEYSDSVPAGTITRFENVPERNMQYVYVSAGPDNATPPRGEIRAPFIDARYALNIKAALPSCTMYGDNNTSGTLNIEVEYSADGIQWQRLTSGSPSSYFDDHEELVDKVVPNFSRQMHHDLFSHLGDVMGRTLQLRLTTGQDSSYEDDVMRELERLLEEAQTPEEALEVEIAIKNFYNNEGIDLPGFSVPNMPGAVPLEQTLTLEYAGEALRIDSVEKLSMQEAAQLVENGEATSDQMPYEVFEAEGDYPEELCIYRLTGAFVNNQQYVIDVTNNFWGGNNVYCQKSGEVFLTFWNGTGDDIKELTVYSDFDFSTSADGLSITASISPPTTYTL